ncbi:enhancer of mRNA-decapping protein 4-like [Plodia interpunctella]|uniref:enhancer of mRNA-decapping protein 4-like n=1 Tax=Plodia interpunctella TaxID=58824 RepID=UPI0023688695|nr:enhancer of mRNA-decapping protein 4-like [Plodia interpunctella]
MSPAKPLRRSKSLCSLHEEKEINFPSYRQSSRRISDSSVEIFVVNDSGSDASLEKREDSGIGDVRNGGALKNLEVKIDRLSDLFTEQCKLLTAIKEEIHESKGATEHQQLFEELTAKAFSAMQGRIKELLDRPPQNIRATTLLNAIDKPALSLDREVREALMQFLQNDELKERMVTATAQSVKEVISSCISKDMCDIYLPTLERSHRRLSRHMARVLADAFAQYENSAIFLKHTNRASRALRRSLEQHELLLQTPGPTTLHQVLHDTIEQFLKTELKDWREKVVEILSSHADDEPGEQLPPTPLECAPVSPLQPANPDMSIIDQLMQSAEVNKLIQDGDVNGAFERALSASDLSVVMAACRAADPAKVFIQPCLLEQSVLMSLVQQLATDMLHETQLKCRYLEDALIHLKASNPSTRAHLPLVVGEVRKHLMKFLHAYPSHVASRRISLIIMAADNLLK